MSEPEIPTTPDVDDGDSQQALLAFMRLEQETAVREEPAPPIRPIVLARIRTEAERTRTFAELDAWLAWFLRTYAVEAVDFPYGCWTQHPYVVEECLAVWTAWRAMHKPDAHPADPLSFNERVPAWRQRLRETYRGRCKNGHLSEIDRPALQQPGSL